MTHDTVVSTTNTDKDGNHIEDRVYMPDHIKDRCDLAQAYAEDGAYYSAARVLTELAGFVQEHADRVSKEMGV